MLRMIDYNAAKQRLRISGSDYTNNREVWKKWAIANGADQTPFQPGQIFGEWVDNRLVPVEALTQMYIITIDPNNGESTYTIKVPAGQTPNPTTPTYSGYTFTGWYPTIVPATEDRTYTAQWTPDIPTYTVKYFDDDGSLWWQTPQPVQQGTSPVPTPTNGTPQPTNPQPGYIYTFNNWKERTSGKFVTDISSVQGNYEFIPDYNGTVKPNNNVKILDNIGRWTNSSKPSNTVDDDSLGIVGYIGGFYDPDEQGWFSGPHDGQSIDTLGQDHGISASGSSTGRTQVGAYTIYEPDSIVYEYLTIASDHTYANGNVALNQDSTYKTINDITAADIITEWTGYDENGNAVLHIQVDPSCTSWLGFAIIGNPAGYTQSVTFVDVGEVNPTVTAINVPIKVQIVYYIKDNSNNKAREGKININTYGSQYGEEKCKYVYDATYVQDPQYRWSDDSRKYMTNGTVFFYQLGTSAHA